MTPTTRLLKAADAEREQLARHRNELLRTRERLRAELARIEDSLGQITEREALLDRLVGVPDHGKPVEDRPGDARPPAHAQGGDDDDRPTVLRGPEIRREAVRVVLAHPGRPEALHYRDWYALLREAGYAAGGKDPLATFLTQLSRSPAVRKSTQAGVYELDHDAWRRLRRRHDEVQRELRELTAAQSDGAPSAAIRSRRTELNTELGRVEKALEEVQMLFDPEGEPALAA